MGRHDREGFNHYSLIIQQRGYLGNANVKAQRIKTLLQQERRQCQAHLAEDLQRRLPPQFQWCLEVAKEKGASSWLEALPVRD